MPEEADRFPLRRLFPATRRRAELLENDVRAELVELIQTEPGIHLQGLVDRVGVGNGAVRYHLRRLEDGGLIERRESEGFTRFFPEGYPKEKRARASILRAGCNREVYQAYLEDPDRTLRELAEEVDRSVSTVHRAVEMLREAELIPPEEGRQDETGAG